MARAGTRRYKATPESINLSRQKSGQLHFLPDVNVADVLAKVFGKQPKT